VAQRERIRRVVLVMVGFLEKEGTGTSSNKGAVARPWSERILAESRLGLEPQPG
jgi:hypothetical protein